MDPKWKVGHWSARIYTTKERNEEVKGAENEKPDGGRRGHTWTAAVGK